MNPLYNLFNNNQNAGPAPQQNNMFARFNQFVNQMRGVNPQQEVQRLLQSGQMTQEQYNQIQQTMNNMFGRRK